MIQPCVLPSNASPLVGGSEPAPRVLQEHSVNRQHTDFKFTQDYEQKYPPSLLSENVHPRLPIKTQPLFRPHHHSSHAPFRSGFARHSYGRHYPTAAEKDAKARSLMRRFQSSESYAKYRSRQSKETEKPEDQKWPDHLEHAFFRALVEYPPVGRKKSLFKQKQRGRNELIADWIEMATGQIRNRKQVSSHIQVLKPFVCDDPQIMAYLSKPSADSERYHNAYVPNHASGRGLSSYPVQAPPPRNGRQAPHILVLGGVSKHGKLRDVPNVFEPVDFEMFVQRKLPSTEHGHDDVERLHTYTKQISLPWEEDEVLSDWNHFAQKHASLAVLHSQRPIECNVIAAQASLALHSGPWTDRDGLPVGSTGVELGISFHCRTGEIPRSFEVICHNQFFERGKLIEQSNHTNHILEDGSANNDIQIMFGSNFWVGALSARYKEACESGAGNGQAFIASISATQDIFIKTVSALERVMLIHWTFRQSTRPVGRTSWKRVILPHSMSALQCNSPVKSQVDTPFNFNDDPMPNLTASGAPPQPALQSPFEYESGSGSALSSATWPNAMNDATGSAFAGGNNMDVDLDNAFDFTGGNIDISYDPNLSLDNFDTSTFNFDAPAEDYVADPAMQDYSQPWVGSYTGSFDGQQSFADTSFSASAVAGSQNSGFGEYDVYDPQIYGAGQESQAFGRAGQEVIKEEDPLVGIADAPDFTMAAVAAVAEGQEAVI